MNYSSTLYTMEVRRNDALHVFAPSLEFYFYLLDIYGFLEQIKGFALVLKEFSFVDKETFLYW
jgi:hypothetical protein